MRLSDHDQLSQERVLPGKHHWWFLGPGGIARLSAEHVTAAGTVRPDAQRRLRELGLYTPRAPALYALTVLTSTACNLGCGYCFQNIAQDPAGGSRPPRIAPARLTASTIAAILRFTSRKMAGAGLGQFHLTLFGGEPLLNPGGCLELLDRGAEHGLASASMVSNLTLLTPTLAKSLSGRGLTSIQVTLDGDHSDHDRIRVRRAGGGTFDHIIRGLALASEVTPMRWLLRVNVSGRNQDGVDGLIDRLGSAVDPSRCTLHFARVADVGIGYPDGAGEAGESASQYIHWHRRAIDAGFSLPRPRARVPCQTCGYADGRYGAVVSADGTLSSCWDTAGRPDWQVGTIREGYRPDTGDRWVSCLDHDRRAHRHRASDAVADDVDAALLDQLSEAGQL